MTCKWRCVLAVLAGGIVASQANVIASDIHEAQREIPLGLPQMEALQKLDKSKIDLGRKLFFDRRLSFNGTMSCAMCHVPAQAFASTQSATAIGTEGRSLRRNAPSLLNVAYQTTLFHDGRENDLAFQIWSPLLSPVEMANPSVGYVIDNIRKRDDYNTLFKEAFGDRGVDMQTTGEALAEYQRSLLAGNSRFDRWRYGGRETALTSEEKRGYQLFTGKAACSACHTVGETSALFTDQKFHATGIGYRATVSADPETWQIELESGVFTEVANSSIASVSEARQNDLGRFEITLNPEDRWAYKTPSLRDVALSFPYMHDGSLKTLDDVVEFYNEGGVDFAGKSPLVQPLHLTQEEKSDLVAFLKSLTSEDSPIVEALKKPVDPIH